MHIAACRVEPTQGSIAATHNVTILL